MRLSQKIWAGACLLLLLGAIIFFSYKNSYISYGWYILLAGCLSIIFFSCIFLYICLRVKEKHEAQLVELNKALIENRQLIMNAALDAIICINTSGKIIFWNPQAEKVFGWTSEEVNGKLLSDIIIPEAFRDRHEAGMVHYLKTGHGPALNVMLDLSALYRDGTEFPIELTVLPIKQGEEQFFCAFIRDITERKTAEAELQEKNTELRKLSNYLQNVREQERKYIAREVHDELGQLVSAMKIDIDWLNTRIQTLDESGKKRLDHASKTLEVLILSIRKMATSLRPSILDDFGLNATIEWQCKEMESLHEMHCSFQCNFDDQDLSIEIKTELFRIVQESLANVVNHAQAANVTIDLSDDETNVYLTIADDGKGFDTTLTKNTLGLVGLRERAASVNGNLRIQSKPGGGTTVHAIIPK